MALGKKAPHKKAEITRDHINAFRDIIYGKKFQEQVTSWKSIEDIKAAFNAVAASVMLGPTGKLKSKLRRKFETMGCNVDVPMYKSIVEEKENGSFVGNTFVQSWNDMNRPVFISFDFTVWLNNGW